MSDPLGLISKVGSGGVNPLGAAKPPAGAGGDGASFKDVLMKQLEQVNQLQSQAESAIEDLAAGKRDDVAGVLIAKQKADMAFEMLLQVRNKLMDGYEEIKQIRV